jgi:hypothetical protein
MIPVTLISPPYRATAGVKAVAVFDRVAVHPSLTISNTRHPDGTWTVTHLVSGTAIEDRMPTPALALDLAEQLDGLPELDYHRNVAARSPRVRRIVGEFRERIGV